MKVIEIRLAGKVYATVDENYELDVLIGADCKWNFNLRQLFDNSFYNIPDSKTFKQRYELVKQGRYFCFSKPQLILIAVETRHDSNNEILNESPKTI